MAELVEALSFPDAWRMPFWTYMLHCSDRTFYVGHTDDLEKRIGQHELGLIPGYSSERLPVKLVWSEEFATRDEARAAERKLKGWGRLKKLALIRGDWAEISVLAKGDARKEGASTSSAKPGSEGGEGRGSKETEATRAPRGADVERFLHPHLASISSQPLSLEVRVRRSAEAVHLRYRLTGAIADLRIPRTASPQRRDELWRCTCFEAFLQPDDGPHYLEFNFSPSGDWAAYRFDSYRNGMAPLSVEPPRVRCEQTAYAVDLSVAVRLSRHRQHLRVNLAAVIEEKDGTKSYWALAHPPEGPPDFHHPDCFVLELPPPAEA